MRLYRQVAGPAAAAESIHLSCNVCVWEMVGGLPGSISREENLVKFIKGAKP
jgi:hypothetical protein